MHDRSVCEGVSNDQIVRAEARANQIVFENRPVGVRFVSIEEARSLGLRKLPDLQKDEMRLVEIRDFDLCACGGTHVTQTSQIGTVLIRKTEKVKQGIRVEFVCGDRALRIARRDYATLTEAAGLFSGHIYDVPQQIKKTLDEVKAAQKRQHALLEEIAELRAAELCAERAGSREVQGGAAGVRGSRSDVHQIAGAEADEISGNAGAAGLDCISCGSRVCALCRRGSGCFRSDEGRHGQLLADAAEDRKI